MIVNGALRKLYELSEWITKMMYVNLLWILFTLMGVVIFGFFPATVAMFTVVREWLIGEKDIPVFKTFWGAYKQNFIQANLVGFILIVIGLILYVDLRFFQTSEQFILQLFSFLIFFALLIYFALLLYVFPVYVHFNFKTFEYIKYSFVMAIGRPLVTIMMIVGSALVLILLKYVPILLFFLGGGLMSFILMWIALKSFPTEKLQDSLES
jgi:uncharacterized membrane protein YesL